MPEFGVDRLVDGTLAAGDALTDIYTYVTGSTFTLQSFEISINDGGTVAFLIWTPVAVPTRYAILVGDGGPPNSIADTNVHTQYRAQPSGSAST